MVPVVVAAIVLRLSVMQGQRVLALEPARGDLKLPVEREEKVLVPVSLAQEIEVKVAGEWIQLLLDTRPS